MDTKRAQLQREQNVDLCGSLGCTFGLQAIYTISVPPLGRKASFDPKPKTVSRRFPVCVPRKSCYFFFFFHYEARACPYWKASFKFKDNCSLAEIRGVFSGIRAPSSEARGPGTDFSPPPA